LVYIPIYYYQEKSPGIVSDKRIKGVFSQGEAAGASLAAAGKKS
jgi:hypothetical protein